MKPKDFGTIVFLGVISATLAYILSASFVTNKKSLTSRVEVVAPISKDFNFAGKSYFDPKNKPLNPTKEITIDTNNTAAPLDKN
jgi:hypothetical protein